MSALIGPLDTRVAVRQPINGEDTSSWHGYDIVVDPSLSCSEIATIIGANYSVEVLRAVEVERPAGTDADQPATRVSILGGGNQIVTALPEPDMDCPCPELDEELLNQLQDMDDDLKPDHWVLGRVGSDYSPIQNSDLCGLLDTFLASCRDYAEEHPESPLALPRFETMGTLNNRRRFWAQITLGGFGVAITPALAAEPMNDEHDPDDDYVDIYAAFNVSNEDEDGDADESETTSVRIQHSTEFNKSRLVSMEKDGVLVVRSEAPDVTVNVATAAELFVSLDDAITDVNDPRVEWLDRWSKPIRDTAEWIEVKDSALTSAPSTLTDDIAAYLLVTTSHDGKSLATVSVVFVRVVCNNTLGAAMDTEERVFSIKHVGDTSIKLRNASAGLDWLVKTMHNEAARLSSYASTGLLDEEAHLLIGSFFGFGGKQGWLTERARKLWTGEDLRGAETAPAGTLYRLLNVLTQVIEESQSGKDGGDEAAQAAATARVSGEWRGRYSPTEASALCASVIANREAVLMEARKEASIAQRKQDERAAKQAEKVSAKSGEAS